MLSTFLGNLGHALDAVPDAETALVKIRETAGTYDIVITDHQMPKMTGLELVEVLRAEKFAGRIMVLSGRLSQPVKDAYKKLKVDMIIHKPFDLYEIEEAVSGFSRKRPGNK